MSIPSIYSFFSSYFSTAFFDTAAIPTSVMKFPITDMLTKIFIGFASFLVAMFDLFNYIKSHSFNDIVSQHSNN